MKFQIAFAIAFTCSVFSIVAQPSIGKMAQALQREDRSNPGKYLLTKLSPVQLAVRLNNSTLTRNNLATWLSTVLDNRPAIDELRFKEHITDAGKDLQTVNLFQYFKGIKVEHAVVKATTKAGTLAMMSLEYYSIPADFNIIPSLDNNAAYRKAATAMGIKGEMPDLQERASAGELVIVRTYADDSSVCLAWKFDIVNQQPVGRAYVYVHAQSGKIVLKDAIIKHVNSTGTAATRTNGSQQFVTDNEGGNEAQPYRLRQTRNGHEIITLNYRQLVYGNDVLAVEFTDNDNNWTAAEYNNSNQDNAALDVHFNMQIVSDYWKLVHNRNSWDGNNSPLLSFIHVNEKCKTTNTDLPMDNAFWGGSAMYYGDGTFGTSSVSCSDYFKPLVSLDITAHEVGHGISESVNRLIYRWESGALSEGFSDIWAAIIEQWGKEQYPAISSGKNTWLIGEEITAVPGKGIRNMQAPGVGFPDPSAYKDANWRLCEFPDCFPNDNNDQGGVHRNSGVINKWFYLITMGEAATNTLGVPYNVSGMGFTKSRELIYLTALNLTPNSSFSTARAVSLDAAVTLYGRASAEVQTVLSAWRAVGVDSAIWDISNTPVFAASNNEVFTCIEVGEDGWIWAGTDKKGLYVYDGTSWTQRPEIANVKINDIKQDKYGGIWVAQSGTVNTSMATAGGVNHFADRFGPMTSFYTNSTVADIPSRNVRSILIDQSRVSPGPDILPRVWIATTPFLNDAGNFSSGRLAVGVNTGTPKFTPVTSGLDIGNTANGTPAIGGNRKQVWTFASNNNGRKQILCYDAGTHALLATFDNTTDPIIPANFTVTAIYNDVHNRTWFGLTTNAVLVRDQFQTWHYISIPAVFIAGSQTNPNAITGNKFGDVYIGTTAGLVFFDQGIAAPVAGSVAKIQNYKIFKKQNGLPSSNVTDVAFDPYFFKVWVATDKGICRWDPLCLGNSCNAGVSYLTRTSRTAQSGNWSDTATWEDKQIPDSNTLVFIDHSVQVNMNAQCFVLQVAPGGALVVNAARHLTLYTKPESIYTGSPQQRQARN